MFNKPFKLLMAVAIVQCLTQSQFTFMLQLWFTISLERFFSKKLFVQHFKVFEKEKKNVDHSEREND